MGAVTVELKAELENQLMKLELSEGNANERVVAKKLRK
jgi:hypothetical protein